MSSASGTLTTATAPENPATRLLRLVRPGLPETVGAEAVEVWAKLLGIPATVTGTARYREVSHGLVLAHDQCLRLQALLPAVLPYATWAAPIDSLTQAISIQYLPGQWGTPRAALTDKVMTTLEIVSHLLPSTEAPISEKELQDFLRLIDEFTKDVTASGMSSALMAFLLDSASKMRRAARDYRVQGMEAFIGAMNELVNDVTAYDQELKQEPAVQSRVVALARELWTFLGRAEDARKRVAVARLILEGVAHAHLLADAVKQLGSGGT
jgi:hypothetical protein